MITPAFEMQTESVGFWGRAGTPLSFLRFEPSNRSSMPKRTRR